MNKNKQINKILVANRGEIAIRVFRACNELGIKTVAIYSHEDRLSQHKFKADESYLIGDVDQAVKPYLDIDEILKIAKKVGVDAIHPGYGFLSESQELVKRCNEENIVFIGPKVSAMEQLGNKVLAKKVAIRAGVPIIESNQEELKNAEIAMVEAKRIGYPVMLKAADGGGGRGMRIIRSESELEKSFNEARNESLKAFGSDKIFIEKYIDKPKHIEVQILADQAGNIVHLYERDCSIQRRFQKVVEIAPCSSISQKTKEKLYEYAVKLAKEVNYSSLGTVEFLVDQEQNIYFIEVNPRIQVEHTITEEVTGVDLVRSQILIACGTLLTDKQIFINSQEDVQVNGFAVQCRITTENPLKDFKPDYGTIIAYRNAGGFGIRLDEGNCYQGVTVSPSFDSLLVKVTAKGRTFKGTVQRLARALREFRIRGVKTNILFLQNILKDKDFMKSRINVHFINDKPDLFKIKDFQDRGTKTLKYLAGLIVNGHPTIKGTHTDLSFPTAIIPKPNFSEYQEGSRDRLLAMGRDEFVKSIKNDKKIHYTDTTFRDGHQSLLATRLRSYDMLKVAEGFAKDFPEVFSMEVWGGATFDVCLRFLNEDPWKRLVLLREKIPNILLQMLFRGSNGMGYTSYPDNLIDEVIVKSAETGVDVFRVFDSFNSIESVKPAIKAILDKTKSLCQGTLCYTDNVLKPSDGKYTLKYYQDLAKELVDLGVHSIAIKDMAGLLTPYAAVKLIEGLNQVVQVPISLHTHDTSSIQSATYLKAIEHGVDVVDVAISSLSGLTSQPNFNSIAHFMQERDRDNPLNLNQLNEYGNYWEDVRSYYFPFETDLKSGTAEVYEHEIPGGQYSNLRPQAKALGLEAQFFKVKKNYALANKLLGNITKVTPSSKVVGDLSLFITANNLTEQDILEKGSTYSYPESLINLMKGHLGKVEGGFPEDFKKMVLKGESELTSRAGALLPPVNLEKEYREFKEEFKILNSYTDFLSYKLYPKVFSDYYQKFLQYGDLMMLPTKFFFYPLEKGEELLFEIEDGKDLMIQYVYKSEPDPQGIRKVNFLLNGKTRVLKIKDDSAQVTVQSNRKKEDNNPNEIGSPLQGIISSILVKVGDKVEQNQPLFVIEAMKMESTFVASRSGVVEEVVLAVNDKVEQNDLVVVLG